MFRIGLALACVLAAAGMATAASPDPRDLAIPPAELARAKELVRRLGSEDYKDREAAQGELARMGRLALPALVEAGVADPNPEVRSRAARLLPKAEAEDLQARIDTFLADAELAYEHELPGWREFRIAAGVEWRVIGITLATDKGVEKAARKVYLELIDATANRNLMQAVGGPPGELGSMVGARKVELFNIRFPRGLNTVRRDPTAPEVLTLLFAESQVRSRYVPAIPAVRAIANVVPITSPAVYPAFTAQDACGEVYRSVVGYWLDTRDEPVAMYQALSLATTLNLAEPGGRVAARLVTESKALPTYRAQAAVTLVRFEGRQHLPALEQAMADTTPVLPARGPGPGIGTEEIQVRDVALAAALTLTGQRPEDYGFVSRYGGSSGLRSSSYLSWYFPPDKRDAAFAKWAEWRQANPEHGM